MTRTVIVAWRARHDLLRAVEWWAENRSADQASRWYKTALRRIESLARDAHRCSRSTETKRLGIELFDAYFGLGRSRTHRLVFTICDDVIRVVTIRHLAQAPLTLDDLN
jgi:plasmid stabilization system protein ParE